MFRAILVAVKPAQSQEFVLDFAGALAERHRLALDACSIIDLARLAPAQPVPIGGGAFKAERDAQIATEASACAAALMAHATEASRNRKVMCRAQVREGDTATVLADTVQTCDLLVCGHTRGGDASERSLLHSILKHSPRPAIVVPQEVPLNWQDVLVAYDGTAQAARALASFAQSGLAAGRTVHLCAFDNGSGVAELQAAAAKTFLERHEVPCETRIGPLTGNPAAQILDEVARVSAGLIVMGAFGQNAVREFFLGSVTRSMLDVLPAPVFLDH